MGCSCRKAKRAGSKTATGKTIVGYEVTFAAGDRAPQTFLSLVEARAALRVAGGGGTIITKVQ